MKKTKDNKRFWTTVKLYLSDKQVKNDKISLIEQGDIINNGNELTGIFNDFFSAIVPNLNLQKPPCLDIDDCNDPVLKSIK